MATAMRRGVATILLLALSVVIPGCSKPPSHAATPAGSGPSGAPQVVPPIPSEPSGDAGQAPLVWIGGTLLDMTDRQVVVRETLGPKVELRRLGQDATVFLQVVGGAWQRVGAPAASPGTLACVETLLDGQNLLALRVFLGLDCGPAG